MTDSDDPAIPRSHESRTSSVLLPLAACTFLGLALIVAIVALSGMTGDASPASVPMQRSNTTTVPTLGTTGEPTMSATGTTPSGNQDALMVAEIRARAPGFTEDLAALKRYSQAMEIDQLRRSAMMCENRCLSSTIKVNDYQVSADGETIRQLYLTSLEHLSTYCQQVIRGCHLLADDDRTAANEMFSKARGSIERYEETAAALNEKLKKY